MGSLNGNVSLVAGKDLSVRGSDIVAAGDVTGIGQNVTIESAQERRHHDETREFKRSGFTLALKSPVIAELKKASCLGLSRHPPSSPPLRRRQEAS
ncbi:filamentous hemagglutinin [Pandoraea horticolens]|uniref:Filamentous hemagglutinin n=1 Tax=Pandoraea horticolens TaxID=2508298 RepID=A0A5E4XSH5_9BURK|nr:hemagglutinin repeat-containing protein [Pandoraea horticolens]VVE39008.1 filamentous hemagglutinin [Pandoraea horticolens]